ncbi:uncharacterized protein BDW43DRAFT_290842 [Aspergillus alliaceus]|uniref:uncharacterized protein n=1 Tax=Petromyces alliaceus TaxID=209559 RepID=UPI0012A3C771|nr:uncharacterized protein BDW43DRAFT_290842 [Aspergillus alliaceus]KAB8228571.1 hypothetical protein BDW43DRAFT_290842 [Aspergillus alliaceus]
MTHNTKFSGNTSLPLELYGEVRLKRTLTISGLIYRLRLRNTMPDGFCFMRCSLKILRLVNELFYQSASRLLFRRFDAGLREISIFFCDLAPQSTGKALSK